RRCRTAVEGGKRRRDDDLDVVDVLHSAPQLFGEHDRLLNGLEHLPVAGNEGDSHRARFHTSVRAATPGSVRPARNSSDAPPPVEICVILSATPAFRTAAIESPPPMIVVPLTAATARATALVPAANASISNTPIGPFHTTVLASASRAWYALIVAGPMSTPIRSPMRGSPIATTSIVAPVAIRSVTTWSTGSSRSTPCFTASASI